MSKYNYDSKYLKGLGVGDFLNETKVRAKHIAEGENTIPTSIYNPNIIAKQLHPHFQLGIVKEVIDRKQAKSYVIAADKNRGFTELAYFEAGQYVSVTCEFDGKFMCRPYSICSAPKDALKEESTYTITIKKIDNGYVSDYILNNWKVGTEVTLSGPLGHFNYERLRDAKNVIALAGGSGVTPFVAMAHSIVDNEEDYNLTILYGNRTYDDILLKDELEALANKSDKIKLVHVLSDEVRDGCEHGFISADIIRKYAADDYSIFVCGPKAMYKYEQEEIKKLNLPRRRVRFELSGEYGDPTKDEKYPKDINDVTFNVRVWVRGEYKDITCKNDQTLLRAIEEAGIRVTSDCRSGMCGWCHSRLIKGDTYIPESNDGRRLADKKFGWIHPCATYPLSDIEMEVFPNC
ncbi:MAG: iron-sulfur cluster-binding domain-containing protein [Erysipelotrichaceae bacterium]|nr:iron-sulfur cluster-binding domain-containing protein [Erysipelotrichaceae bacterium]